MQEISVNNITIIESEIITLTQQAQKMALSYICEIGKRLIQAKEIVGHGGWGTWLEERVHYSQSTAENYMKIYREFGDEQMGLFSSVQSEKFQKLPYTKLLALTALSSEERDELSENVDIENISVKELQAEIAEIKKEKEDSEEEAERLREKLEAYTHNESEMSARITELEDKLAAAEKQETFDAGSIKAEYEEKIKKAKEAKKAAEDKRVELEKRIEEEKKKAAEEASAAAAEKAEKKVEKEKKELKAQITDLERKLSSAVSQDTPVIAVYFKQIQEYIREMERHLKNLAKDNPDAYGKLTAGIKDTIGRMIDEL